MATGLERNEGRRSFRCAGVWAAAALAAVTSFGAPAAAQYASPLAGKPDTLIVGNRTVVVTPPLKVVSYGSSDGSYTINPDGSAQNTVKWSHSAFAQFLYPISSLSAECARSVKVFFNNASAPLLNGDAHHTGMRQLSREEAKASSKVPKTLVSPLYSYVLKADIRKGGVGCQDRRSTPSSMPSTCSTAIAEGDLNVEYHFDPDACDFDASIVDKAVMGSIEIKITDTPPKPWWSWR